MDTFVEVKMTASTHRHLGRGMQGPDGENWVRHSNLKADFN